jgi:eukaryotic-like serine/threonine-protein kinase
MDDGESVVVPPDHGRAQAEWLVSDAGSWHRVKTLLDAALDRAPTERAAFLREMCDGDAALQTEVESLLDAHGRAGSFAEKPAIHVLGGAATREERGFTTRVSAMHAGDRFGAYEIGSRIGAGGMGEVYRARDTALGRDVAIKVLPNAFLADPERRARFTREARILAALNHPNVGAIYGLEEIDGVRGLVLELVDGPTLEERLQTGPMSVTETLAVARQIADALDAAHQQTIVHRDLKPANVKITLAGLVKILDFGLAKAAVGESAGQDLSISLGAGAGATREGMLVGTAAYMSPEQARGKPVDKRTDVWAFGCVLFEMLTGRMAFPGETLSDTVVAILEREPDWSRLPDATPPAIRKLLRRCLEKEPKQRLHDMADGRLEIDDALTAPVTAMGPVPPRTRWRLAVAWGLSLIVSVLVAGGFVWRITTRPVGHPSPAGVVRFAITLPAGETLGFIGKDDNTSLALSPDGRTLAYVAGPRLQLYIRTLDGLNSKPLPGTQGADVPSFSPDGQWLAFVADNELKKISLAGGPPVTLVTLGTFGGVFGASWAADGTIVFAPMRPPPRAGLLRVSANGGTPRAVTGLAANEGPPRWPEMLPDGKTVLYSATPADGVWSSDSTIYAQSLETGKRRAVVKGVVAHYLATGDLVYTQSDTLFVVPFDLARLEIAGDPVPVVQGFQLAHATGPQISVSQAGHIAYASAGAVRGLMLVFIDRTGKERKINVPNEEYAWPRLSPDGHRLAMSIQADKPDLWVYDFSRDTLTRFTSERINNFPLWTPDGQWLTFNSRNSSEPANIYWKPADGSLREQRLLKSDHWNTPASWSPDGRILAFVDTDLTKQGSAEFTRQDISWQSRDDHDHPHPFLQTKFVEIAPVFSPDGQWLAYASDESGRMEIYVRPFPGPGGKWQISNDGGTGPVWPRDAHELFYRSGDAMMAVDVKTDPMFSAGLPRRLFTDIFVKSDMGWPNYDVTSDGQRFVMIKAVEDPAMPPPINVVLNGLEDVKRRAPVK